MDKNVDYLSLSIDGLGFFQEHGDTIIVLLCGGDKSSQTHYIKAVQRLSNDREKS